MVWRFKNEDFLNKNKNVSFRSLRTIQQKPEQDSNWSSKNKFFKTNYCNWGKETSVYNWVPFFNTARTLRIYNRGTGGWGVVSGYKITKGKHQGCGGRSGLKSPDRILAECRLGVRCHVGDAGDVWKSHVQGIREGCGFMVNCLPRVFPLIGLYEEGHWNPGFEAMAKRYPQWAWQIESSGESLSALFAAAEWVN